MKSKCFVSIKKAILFMILLVIFLQVLNIYLMLLEGNPVVGKRNHRPILDQIMKEIKNVHVTDSSGYYFILPNILGSRNLQSSGTSNVAVATHTTSNNLQNLEQLNERWQEQISISVLTQSSDAEYVLNLIQRLYECDETIQRNVLLHLVFPVWSHKDIINTIPQDIHCNEKLSMKAHYKNFEIGELQYPHNILRNLALKMVTTSFVLVMDIDLLPSGNLPSSFQEDIIDSKIASNQTAYIVPVFETGENENIPFTKEELLNDKHIRPFYINVCRKCQYYTNYEKWKFLRKSNKLQQAFELQWKYPYEPFFIASKASLPLYQERFKQYGFNRVSQICEMHMAGFNFTVLNNAFLVHKGYKEKNKFYSQKSVDHHENRQRYEEFKLELESTYPDSKRKC